MARFAIQHATQSQSARHAAKTLARMFIRGREEFVATRPIARPARRIFSTGRYALALARLPRVS
jgi:hypothetical protein